MNSTPLGKLSFEVARWLWKTDPAELPRWKAMGIRTLRVAYAVGRDLLDGQLNLHAFGLVYTTLLSLIPLLTVSFAIATAFGLDIDMRLLLERYLQPLGDKGQELSELVVESVKGLNLALLSSLGVLLLFFTVFTLIQKIERAFNFAWHLRYPRRLTKHFEYLGVIILGPLLIFTLFGFTTATMGTRVVTELRQIEPVGALFALTGELVPYLLVIATFTFFYLFVPNTRVKFSSALIGALVAGVAWEAASRIFSSIILSSARYQAIVSGLAIPLLFMIWLYASWLILLVGAAVAFYHQHPEFLGIDREDVRLSNRVQERIGLLIVYLVGKSHYHDEAPWTAAALARRMTMPVDVVTSVIESLEKSRMIAASGRKEVVYLPARPFEEVRVREVVQAVRTAEEGPYLNAERVGVEPAVEALSSTIERAAVEALEDRSVKSWVISGTADESE
jgi:membrane protein